MPNPAPAPVAPPPRADPAPAHGLHCRIRLTDGRTFSGPLPAERHRALQIGLLHADSDGLVELAAGTRRDGELRLTTRRKPDHYLPGGASGQPDWLKGLLTLAARHANAGKEVFVAPAIRKAPSGDKDAVTCSQWLWVDIDQAGQLPKLWAFLAQRPCHLLIQTGGSGGVHAYWKLTEPLAATRPAKSGEVVEPIERAHLRLIYHLGTEQDGKPNVADPAVKDRSRVLRLAGTVNYKTRQYARILEADFHLPGYPLAELIGDLPDPTALGAATRPRHPRDPVASRDPYKQISPAEYFQKLAGIDVPRGGLVRCPAPWHEDRHPSCSVGTTASQGWCCHAGSCGARGAIYDLASVLLGGPYGKDLRGEEFKRARAYVTDIFGDLT
jgi:hypothetical protein